MLVPLWLLTLASSTSPSSRTLCPLGTDEFADVWKLRTQLDRLSAESRLDCAKLALERFPEEYVAHFDAAQVWVGAGKRQKAVSSYERALALNPTFVHAMNNLGGLYQELERYSEAIDILRRGIGLDQQFAGLEYNLGLSYARQDRMKPALRHFRRALAKARPPEPLPRWYDDIASALQGLDRNAEAVAAAAKAVSLEPNNL